MITLALSDVIGDQLDVIASGISVPDLSTFGDCRDVIEKYNLANELPEKVRALFHQPASSLESLETPKSLPPRHFATVLGSNRLSREAVKRLAEREGMRVCELSRPLSGEARIEAEEFVRDQLVPLLNTQVPVCVIAGGETTVTLTRGADGAQICLGGRNQEFALAAALALEPLITDSTPSRVLLASLASDGTDGPTDAAGAAVDCGTIARMRALDMVPEDFLSRHDSFNCFRIFEERIHETKSIRATGKKEAGADSMQVRVRIREGGLLETGPTGTNVIDIVVAIIYPKHS
jgi:hydroxypyruvate reductase